MSQYWSSFAEAEISVAKVWMQITRCTEKSAKFRFASCPRSTEVSVQTSRSQRRLSRVAKSIYQTMKMWLRPPLVDMRNV